MKLDFEKFKAVDGLQREKPKSGSKPDIFRLPLSVLTCECYFQPKPSYEDLQILAGWNAQKDSFSLYNIRVFSEMYLRTDTMVAVGLVECPEGWF